jgi:hypothetical protein
MAGRKATWGLDKRIPNAQKKYWYSLPSPSLVLDPAYLSDTLGVTFPIREPA